MRFGIRTLILASTVLAVLLAREAGHYRAQKRIANILHRKNISPQNCRSSPRFAKWIHELPINRYVSDHVLNRAHRINLNINAVPNRTEQEIDSVLRSSAALGTVEELVTYIHWTDERVGWLRRHTNLEVFCAGSPINDEVVLALSRMPRLQAIAIETDGISPDALRELPKLNHLRTLSLHGEVDAEALQEIRSQMKNTYVVRIR